MQHGIEPALWRSCWREVLLVMSEVADDVDDCKVRLFYSSTAPGEYLERTAKIRTLLDTYVPGCYDDFDMCEYEEQFYADDGVLLLPQVHTLVASNWERLGNFHELEQMDDSGQLKVLRNLRLRAHATRGGVVWRGVAWRAAPRRAAPRRAVPCMRLAGGAAEWCGRSLCPDDLLNRCQAGTATL